MANFKVVDREIFHKDSFAKIVEKFNNNDNYETVHIKKIDKNYWEARYLMPVKKKE